ncbi:dye-decolorizing peroxidase, yfeX-like subgroup [Vibrio ishigakensis]|uniref:Dye-decolorizing peroxidase, yfeX-like subgroup n=1 Tax=Vibrio ishigakensis TaxID=1481914 RepID=A0A0B8P950_9VIBR|nr:Dyp-type peroxidase [Vibrio ishigakensis]GAM59399.1 dye-decolorizing peroxidase, yfeX-like subgroup [Vibrio ishigakensis]
MSVPQSAILPGNERFAHFVLLNITSSHQQVIESLKTLYKSTQQIRADNEQSSIHLAISFSADFWSDIHSASPSELITFPGYGKNNIVAPATDAHVFLHFHSARPDLHFELMQSFLKQVGEHVKIVDEVQGYRYLDDRDMTGFIDGTENPTDDDRATVALIAEGKFAGGSYVMVQKFAHNLKPWHKLEQNKQERMIGRTKPDSVELDDVPNNSHVGRVDLKENGKGLKMLRHSMPYGMVSEDHGLYFVGYCARLYNMDKMLKSMYGEIDGVTDMILNFSQAKTGAYFFAPSESLLLSI